MVFQDGYCEKCGEIYTDIRSKWCKPCLIGYLKNKFTNWTSKNKEIDNFIQRTQLNINFNYDNIIEWVPYNQFRNIKEICKNDFAIIYSAIWKEGPLDYEIDKFEYIRHKNKKIVLKCLYKSQNINEFLDKV
jgi:hypothetical protein